MLEEFISSHRLVAFLFGLCACRYLVVSNRIQSTMFGCQKYRHIGPFFAGGLLSYWILFPCYSCLLTPQTTITVFPVPWNGYLPIVGDFRGHCDAMSAEHGAADVPDSYSQRRQPRWQRRLARPSSIRHCQPVSRPWSCPAFRKALSTWSANVNTGIMDRTVSCNAVFHVQDYSACTIVQYL